PNPSSVPLPGDGPHLHRLTHEPGAHGDRKGHPQPSLAINQSRPSWPAHSDRSSNNDGIARLERRERDHDPIVGSLRAEDMSTRPSSPRHNLPWKIPDARPDLPAASPTEPSVKTFLSSSHRGKTANRDEDNDAQQHGQVCRPFFKNRSYADRGRGPGR